MNEVMNQHDKKLSFDAAILQMDDDLREKLHNILAPCTEQEFFNAYAQAHAKKFGEEWELSKNNPIW